MKISKILCQPKLEARDKHLQDNYKKYSSVKTFLYYFYLGTKKTHSSLKNTTFFLKILKTKVFECRAVLIFLVWLMSICPALNISAFTMVFYGIVHIWFKWEPIRTHGFPPGLPFHLIISNTIHLIGYIYIHF